MGFAYNKVFLTAQVLNANSTSGAQQVLDGKGFTVQTVFTGSTCSFSAKLQVCADAYNNTPGFSPPDANFADLINSPQTFTTSGNFDWIVQAVEYNWVRLVITDNSSGANNGSVTATINVKN